jgi:Dockerin type I domain/PASTA domain
MQMDARSVSRHAPALCRSHGKFFYFNLAVLALFGATSASAAPGLYHRIDVIAATGASGWTGFGNGPSINDKGKVAFVTKSAAGDSVEVWSPTVGNTEISPAFRSPGRSFGEGVQINNKDEVVTWNRVLGASPRYEVRVFRSGLADDSTIMEHASTVLPLSRSYDLLFPFPALNNARVLEDRTRGGNLDGVCNVGEICASEVAFGAFRVPTRSLVKVQQTPISSFVTGQGTTFDTAINTSIARPMIADDGRVVVRANLPSSPILLYNAGLTASTQIAGAAQGFTVLGVAPGITPDGKVVAFAGNRGFGDGVFLSIEDASGKRRLVRILGENALVRKPELGHDALSNPLYFNSIELDSRVGVIYTPDITGNKDQSLVVSFIGTPNSASRTNPGSALPFTFTGQRGLWTMRIDLNAPLSTFGDRVTIPPATPRASEKVCVVPANTSVSTLPSPEGDDVRIDDVRLSPQPFIAAGTNGLCETSNDHQSFTLFSASSPIPVVQIGDVLRAGATTYSVTALAVNGPLAPAEFDRGLLARKARRGDHRLAFWAQSSSDQLMVLAEHLDSDQDGLLDHWETGGLDVTGTGSIDVDLRNMGADPFKRDVFVQMDWTANRPGYQRRPAPGVIQALADFFAAAPALPNGIPAGIKLHVDAGPELDDVGRPRSLNMGVAPLRGGKTITAPGGTQVDMVYQDAKPGSVSIAGVTALSMDDVKSNNFWLFAERGGREFAFLYVVFADAFSAKPDNAAPFRGRVTATVDTEEFIDTSSTLLTTEQLGGKSILITAGTGRGQLRPVKISGTRFGEPVLQVDQPWDVPLDTTSQYVILSGSGGQGAVTVRSDESFAPGKHLAHTFGGYPGVTIPGLGPTKYLGSVHDQWQTLAHEMGHLFTLKHGGTDHVNYKPGYVSLMNYAYEHCPAGAAASGPDGTDLAGAAPCPVDRYALASDAVFDDWSHLDMSSSLNFAAVGTGVDLSDTTARPSEPELTHKAIETQFGPQDLQGPSVAITSPTTGFATPAGTSFAVSFTAVDVGGTVSKAEVLFDVNGNGVVDTGETFAAVPVAGGWSAAVPIISGANGTRILIANAIDRVGNPGLAKLEVRVGAVTPVPVPNVVSLTQAAATTALVSAGLKLGTVTTASSTAVAAGKVLSSDPAAGTALAPGTAVNLVVSSGPPSADLNGDGSVTCADINIVKAAFNKRAGQPGYDARADVNKDGVVDVRDLAFVAQRLPIGTRCP